MGCYFMEIVWRGPANLCRLLEMALIARLKPVEGCDNEKDGGDGVRADRTYACAVYVVLAGAGHGSLARAVKRRRMTQG